MTNKIRTQLYPLALILIYLAWTSHMLLADRWHIFANWWPMSLTMVFGSFVAGASAEAAAVAFPVFTKALQIPAHEARTFGLMIQAVGMMMAGLVILFAASKFCLASLAGSHLVASLPPTPVPASTRLPSLSSRLPLASTKK